MSFKEIKELRKSGDLEGALKLASAALEADSENIWNKRNAGWVYYEYLKKYSSAEHYDNFKKHLLNIKALNLPEGESMMFNQCAWQIGKFVFALKKDEPIDYAKVDSLFEIIKDFHFEKPSEAYSFIYKAFHSDYQNWNRYLDFADWWNFNNFISDDYQKEAFNNRTMMSVVEQAYIAYSKKLLDGEPIDSTGQHWEINKGRAERFMPMLESVVDNHPEYMYPGYYMAKLLLEMGDKENVLSTFLPFAKKKKNDFWVWELMADIVEDDETKFACYCKALSLKTHEDFLVKTRQAFAKMLADKEFYNEAKTEIKLIVETREKNGWKIPNQITNWMNQDWFKNSTENKNNKQLYAQYINRADEILFQDIPEEVVVVEFVNEHKTMLNFVKNKNKYGFFNYRNQIDKPEIGDILKVRFSDDGDNGYFKVLSAKKTDPSTPTEAIKSFEGALKVISPQNFGFVENIFVEPRLINDNSLVDKQAVKGKAILSFNKKRNEMSWKAFEIGEL